MLSVFQYCQTGIFDQCASLSQCAYIIHVFCILVVPTPRQPTTDEGAEVDVNDVIVMSSVIAAAVAVFAAIAVVLLLVAVGLAVALRERKSKKAKNSDQTITGK